MKTSPIELERLLTPLSSGMKIGRFAGVDAAGRPLVRLDGGEATGGAKAAANPAAKADPSAGARAVPALVLSSMANALWAGRPDDSVLLAFPEGAGGQPVLVGFLSTRATQPAAAESAAATEDAAASDCAATTENTALAVRFDRGRREARLDGRSVTLEAQDEIVLKCGQSSLTLRRNGEVVLRGARVLSRATQTQRIRGASVQIN